MGVAYLFLQSKLEMFLVESKGDNYLWRILSYIYHDFDAKDIIYIFVIFLCEYWLLHTL